MSQEPTPKTADERERKASADDTRIERMAEQARGLVDDIKSWLELRVELTQLQVEDRVEEKVNAVAITASVVGLALVTVLFLLVAAAIALGDYFGNAALGYVAVAGFLLVVTIVAYLLRPRIARIGKDD